MSFFDDDRDKEEQDYGVLSYFNDKKIKLVIKMIKN